jgi:hypothetical protein
MDDPDLDDDSAPIGDPFALNSWNVMWLCGTAAVVLTLVVLKMMGRLH